MSKKAKRREGDLCGACQAWRAIAVRDENRGECRLRPPTMIVVEGERYTMWPVTECWEWCMEWRPRAEDAQQEVAVGTREDLSQIIFDIDLKKAPFVRVPK